MRTGSSLLILALPIAAAASIDGAGKLQERSTASSSAPNASRAALTALYEAAGGAWWDRQDNWLSGDPCDRQSPGFVREARRHEVRRQHKQVAAQNAKLV